jgi:hypothetical protein
VLAPKAGHIAPAQGRASIGLIDQALTGAVRISGLVCCRFVLGPCAVSSALDLRKLDTSGGIIALLAPANLNGDLHKQPDSDKEIAGGGGFACIGKDVDTLLNVLRPQQRHRLVALGLGEAVHVTADRPLGGGTLAGEKDVLVEENPQRCDRAWRAVSRPFFSTGSAPSIAAL